MDCTIVLKELFPNIDHLGLRMMGLKVRNIIDEKLETCDKVFLDFSGISIITQGFGDEIVGGYTRYMGLDFVKNRIGILNASPQIKDVLNAVVSYSKKKAITVG